MFRAIFSAAILSVVLLISAGAANAQSTDKNGIFIDLQAPTKERGDAASALMNKAAQKGRVRVIVGMNDRVKAADAPSEVEERAQIESLRASQTSLAQRVGVAAADTVTFEYIPFVSMWVNAAQLGRLLADPRVVNIQEDIPADPGLTQSVPKIAANTLWNQGFAGTGWTVAILDTGVDKSHPMFAGKVVSEACYSTNGSGATSTCPRGVTASTAVGSGVDCKPRGFSVCYHGTHVAGIAAGSMSTLKGVAKNSKIIAIQVFSKQGTGIVTFSTDWVKGLNRVYALRNQFNIASINMSLGFGQFTGPCDTQVPSAVAIIKKLRAAKIATLVSSMNDSWNGDMRSPACISLAIAVGSTTKADAISPFSNHALQVRHMAPGSDIKSALAGGGFKIDSGTSMAAPHVAGAYALLRDVRGNSTVNDISAALECTGVAVTRAGVTENRINLVQAKAYLLNPQKTPKNFPFTSSAPGWFAHIGGWTVNTTSPGFLQINEGSAGWKVATVAHCNEGFDISSRMARVYDSGRSGNTGILFKAQFTGTFVAGYLAAYKRPNSLVILRLDGYNLQTNSGLFKTLCSATVANNDNNFNVVKVVSRGGVHQVFLNGKFGCTAVDYTYGTGRAGVATFVEAPTSNGFFVDNFNIKPVEVVPSSSPAEDELIGDAPAPEAVSDGTGPSGVRSADRVSAIIR